LETHIQLKHDYKNILCLQSGSWFDAPQYQYLPGCCGLPGVLPVLNKAVVEKAVLLAYAMHSEFRPLSFFDRKNYFYPTFPKGIRFHSSISRWARAAIWTYPSRAAFSRSSGLRSPYFHLETTHRRRRWQDQKMPG